MVQGMIEPELFGLEKKSVAGMQAEEYCARVLASICQKSLKHCDRDHGLTINYSQLPDVVCTSVLDFFGVISTPEDRRHMREIAEFDAKTPSFYFAGDAASKQREASNKARWAAQEWVNPLYDELERARSARGCSSQ